MPSRITKRTVYVVRRPGHKITTHKTKAAAHKKLHHHRHHKK